MRRSLIQTLLAVVVALVPFAADAQDGARSRKSLWVVGMPSSELRYNPDHGMGIAAGTYMYKAQKSAPKEERHFFELRGAIYNELRKELDFSYDFYHVLRRGVHLYVDARYEADPMEGFHGFGGAAAPYYRELDRRGGVAFYGIRHDVARVSAELVGKVAKWDGTRFRGGIGWKIGTSFAYHKIGDVTYKKYSDGADNSLYNLYRKYGIISEAAGGRRMEFSGGLTSYAIVDGKRVRHIFSADAGVRVSPDMFDRRADYTKLAVRFGHAIELAPYPNDTYIKYRMGYDGTVWSQGSVPFYVQSDIHAIVAGMPHEGVGVNGMLRGVLQNRVVGDGVAWGGVDVAVQAAQFRLLRKNWFVSPVVFVDAGAVVQPFRLDEMRDVWNNTRLPASERRLIYSGLDEKIHATAGLGVTVHNAAGWSVHALWGKPFARQDGPGAVYAGVKWRF